MLATKTDEAESHYQHDRPDLQAAFLSHFSLDREPFSLTADPDFLYLSPSHSEAIAALELAVHQGRGLAVLTGEVGTGKSTLVAALTKSWRKHAEVAVVNAGISDFDEILALALGEFGLEHVAPSRSETLASLRDHLTSLANSGQLAILIIDEAQTLSDEAFEQLRLLLNIETTKAKLLQIVLVGQPELRARLGRKNLRHVADRIAITSHLEPLEAAESSKYIDHRLQVAGSNHALLDQAAIRNIVKFSKGVPRQLNILCHNALLFAFGDSSPGAGRRHAQLAIKNAPRERLDQTGLLPRRSWMSEARQSLWLGLAATLVVLLSTLAWFRWSDSSDTAAESEAAPTESAVTAETEPAPASEVVEELPTPSDPDAPQTVALELGSSLYELILERYGRYDDVLLSAVLAANPQIQDPETVVAGTSIELPGLATVRTSSATPVSLNPGFAPESTPEPAGGSANGLLDDSSDTNSSATETDDEPLPATEGTGGEVGGEVVRLPAGRSISGMIQERYGRYTEGLLELVLDANPAIEDLRALSPGTPILLPDLPGQTAES